MSLDDALEEEGLDIGTIPIEVLQYLDSEIALCSSCEWWVETGEMDKNDCCSDCANQELI